MNFKTSIKHLRALHEASFDTGNLKEARAVKIAIEHLTKALLAPKIRLVSYEGLVVALGPICRPCAERARGWDSPRWVMINGWDHRVPKRHRSTLCGIKITPKRKS